MAKFTIEVEPVAEDADIRRQLADALAAVEEWRALAKRHETQTSAWFSEAQAEKHTRETLANDLAKCGEELTTARAENERLRGELAKAAEARDIAQRGARQAGADLDHCENSRELMRTERDEARARFNDLCNTDRSAARLVAMIAERDEARKPFAGLFSDLAHLRKMEQGLRVQLANAEADRNAARKALAAQIEKTNKCTRALNAYPGVAELAALRARVAELEGELADRAARMTAGAPIKDLEFLVAVPATRFDAMRARIDELEKAIEAAKVNPLTLFNGIDADSRVHPIDARRSFVGLVVDIGCGAGVVPGAIKMLAAWL